MNLYSDYPHNSDLETRIRNYELVAGEVLDYSRESAATQQLYGLDIPEISSYGTRLLMARRLVEAGVRFVQVFPPAKPSTQPWDSHTNTRDEIEAIAARTELPVSQNGRGRDHNRNAFTLWLAGGGFKAGYAHGATDEFGYKAMKDRVSVPDLQATVLHQLGVDHRKLTYLHHGRDETPTDYPVTGAEVVRELLDRPSAPAPGPPPCRLVPAHRPNRLLPLQPSQLSSQRFSENMNRFHLRG